MLCGIEQFAVEAHRIGIRTVRRIGHRIPKRIILAGIGQVVFVPDLERIGAFEVPERLRIGENDTVIGNGL